MRHASRKWNVKLTEILKEQGYLQSKDDYYLFIKKTSIDFTIVLVYVDDLILAGTSMCEIVTLKNLLD